MTRRLVQENLHEIQRRPDLAGVDEERPERDQIRTRAQRAGVDADQRSDKTADESTLFGPRCVKTPLRVAQEPNDVEVSAAGDGGPRGVVVEAVHVLAQASHDVRRPGLEPNAGDAGRVRRAMVSEAWVERTRPG